MTIFLNLDMPIPKSSAKASTIDGKKIFSKEQVKSLSIKQLVDMRKQGWEYETPAPPWGSHNYQAPGFNPDTDMISPPQGNTYVAGTVPKLPPAQASPDLTALRADPDMQQMAGKMGVGVDDLALLRQMSLDKFGPRYNPPQQLDESPPGDAK